MLQRDPISDPIKAFGYSARKQSAQSRHQILSFSVSDLPVKAPAVWKRHQWSIFAEDEHVKLTRFKDMQTHVELHSCP